MASIISNQTLPACADIIDVSAFNHYITLLAAGIIFILALLQKRRFHPEVFGGRLALIVPLPLLDGYDNRVSYAAAFGAVINIIATLFMNLDSTTYTNVPLWARALVLQFRVLEVCIACFPLFACISTRHKLAGAVLGVTYSSVLLGSTFAEAVQLYCQGPPYSATDSALTVYQAVSVLIYLPVVLCFLYLIFKFLLTITECIRSSTYVITEPLKRVYTHQQQYVRLVLHRDYDPSKETTTCDKLIYRSIPAFKYPVRIISVVFILLILLYRIGLFLILVGAQIVRWRGTFRVRLPFPGTKFILLTPVVVDLLAAVYFITTIVCVIVTSFNIYLFMKSYRRHLLRMFRGNKSFILDQLPKPHIMMANSMRFPGYQVAYMLGGFSMLFLGLFVAGFIFTFGIYGLIISHLLTYVLKWLLQALWYIKLCE